MTTSTKQAEGNPAEWKDGLDGHREEAGDSLATASEAVIEFVKERPVLCLLGALAAGYVVGRIVRR
jgi:hypothetical protein